MRVLVCGGSRFKDKDALYRELDEVHENGPISLIINGGARGADYFASQWAKERDVPLRVFKADWKNLGQKAVFALNNDMLKESQPGLVIAFPGGDVTKDMIQIAISVGIEIIEPMREGSLPNGGDA
jgi:hypothetical protein